MRVVFAHELSVDCDVDVSHNKAAREREKKQYKNNVQLNTTIMPCRGEGKGGG